LLLRLRLVADLRLDDQVEPAKGQQQVGHHALLEPLFGQRDQPLLAQQARQLRI
jgi:hypothetical protein